MVCWKHGRELYDSWRIYNGVAEFGLILTITALWKESSLYWKTTISFFPSILHGTVWIMSVPILVDLQELGWIVIAASICSQFVCPSIDVWILLSLPANTISRCNLDVLWSWRFRVCVAGKKYTRGLAFPLEEYMFPTLFCLLGGCITALLSPLCFNFLRSVINVLVIQLAIASRFKITCHFGFLHVVFMHVVWSLVAGSYFFFHAVTNHFSFLCEWWASRAV